MGGASDEKCPRCTAVRPSVRLPASDVSGVRGVGQVLEWFPTERGEEGTAGSLKVTDWGGPPMRVS